jgi:ribonuclease VapC
MVLDSSALLAILLGEPEAPHMVRVLARTQERLIGAPTLVEASAVMLARKGPGGEVALDALLRRLDVKVVSFTESAATLARLAYGRFGKGVGNPDVLNYGDCMAYGMAMALGQPLLFKGDNFLETDVLVPEG